MKRVSATEAARGFADILNRVRYQDEEYEVVRNGEPVARILPANPAKAITAKEMAQFLGSLPPVDDSFLADLIRSRNSTNSNGSSIGAKDPGKAKD